MCLWSWDGKVSFVSTSTTNASRSLECIFPENLLFRNFHHTANSETTKNHDFPPSTISTPPIHAANLTRTQRFENFSFEAEKFLKYLPSHINNFSVPGILWMKCKCTRSTLVSVYTFICSVFSLFQKLNVFTKQFFSAFLSICVKEKEFSVMFAISIEVLHCCFCYDITCSAINCMLYSSCNSGERSFLDGKVCSMFAIWSPKRTTVETEWSENISLWHFSIFFFMESIFSSKEFISSLQFVKCHSVFRNSQMHEETFLHSPYGHSLEKFAEFCNFRWVSERPTIHDHCEIYFSTLRCNEHFHSP